MRNVKWFFSILLLSIATYAKAQPPAFNTFMDQGTYIATLASNNFVMAPPDNVNTFFSLPGVSANLNYRHQDSLQSHLAWRWLQLKYDALPATLANTPTQMQYITRIATSDGPGMWWLTLAMDRMDFAFFAVPFSQVVASVSITSINNFLVHTAAAPIILTPTTFAHTFAALKPNSVYEIVITIVPGGITINPYDHVFDLIVSTP